MKNIISITEARSSIFDIAEKIQKQGNHYIFTENGKAKMAVMSAEEYENLMEDLTLSADSKFRSRMKKADEEFARGEYYTWDEVKAGLDRRKSLFVADKAKKGYSVKKSKKNNK
ncbi:MAG: type II toxin-antitoxin system Phd/YefM family antitoxin [Minisyncoccia bacterium]